MWWSDCHCHMGTDPTGWTVEAPTELGFRLLLGYAAHRPQRLHCSSVRQRAMQGCSVGSLMCAKLETMLNMLGTADGMQRVWTVASYLDLLPLVSGRSMSSHMHLCNGPTDALCTGNLTAAQHTVLPHLQLSCAVKAEGYTSLLRNVQASLYYRWTLTQEEEGRLWYPPSTAYKLWSWLRQYTVSPAHGFEVACLPPVVWHQQLNKHTQHDE